MMVSTIGVEEWSTAAVPKRLHRASVCALKGRLACGSTIIWLICALLFGTDTVGNVRSDIDGDGIVNLKDLAIVAREWLDSSSQAVVKPAIQSYPAAIGLTRDSVACGSKFRTIPANVPRYEKIAIASRPKVFVNTEVSRHVLAVDGGKVICSDYLPVYSTTDGEHFELLFDLSTDERFAGYYEEFDYVRGIKVLSDGSWLLVFGPGTSGGPGRAGHLFRSVDKGTTWTHVLAYERGFTAPWGFAIRANEIAAGEYGALFQEDNCRRIYYSDDFGATWSKIYELEPNPKSHIHMVAFPPGDTNSLYVSTGDYQQANTVKILKYTPGPGGKRNTANWAEAAESPLFERQSNPVSWLIDEEYIYFGHDAFYSPVIWRVDPKTNEATSVLNWPRPGDSPEVPYVTGNSQGVCFGMLKYDGVYYAAVYNNVNYPGGGMYVSVDGEHWTCAYRLDNAGFANIIGFANGYLWGTYWDYYHRRIYKMSPVDVETVEATCVDRGIVNQLDTPQSSSFEGGVGTWVPRTTKEDLDEELSGLSTEMALHGRSSYKLALKDKPDRYGAHLVSGPVPVNPSAGDYICASFWITSDGRLPTSYIGFARIKVIGEGGIVQSEEAWFDVPRYRRWQKVTIWGKCIDDNFTDGIQIWLGVCDQLFGTGYFTGTACYIDCAQIVYMPDLHYSGTWQVGGTPRADEVARQSLAGLGSPFTSVFEWAPQRARREWHADIPVATWTDGEHHLDLYYDHLASKFIVTDGINWAETPKPVSWDHIDNVKFALANLGGDLRLSVETPLDGVQHVETTGGTMEFGAPVAVTFGTDSTQSTHGCGLIAKVRHFDSILTTAQVEQAFQLVQPTQQE